MASGRRRGARIRVGARVKVCMDNHTDILTDMGICGPDDSLLSDIWMYGTVTETSFNNYKVKLPAARTEDEECVLSFPKAKVLVPAGPDPPDTYVVFGDEIKTLSGLVIGGNLLSADYFDSLANAKKRVHELAQNSAPAEDVVHAPAPTTSTTEDSQTTNTGCLICFLLSCM